MWPDRRPTPAAGGGDRWQRGAVAARVLLALALTLAGAGAYAWRTAPGAPSADVSGGQNAPPATDLADSVATSPPPTTTPTLAPSTPTPPAAPTPPDDSEPPADEAGGDAGVAPPTETVRYRVEVRTADATGADFAATVHDVLTDPRGWVRAGFEFVRDPEARFRIVLAEGGEIDRLCHPYDTGGRYSCQNGPVVALNADRWRRATEQWAGDLAGYRTMLVNHEVGHLLHLHHPKPQCPGPGLPAPVMAQQSSGTDPCHPHPWPLQWEVELAAERREPLAPGADHDPEDHRPTPPPATE